MSALHEAAERWLTRALSEAMGSVPGVAVAPGMVFVTGTGDGPNDHDDQPMGVGGVLALEAIGALSAGEAAIWLRRFELARGGAAPEPDPEAAAAAREHLRGLVGEGAEPADRTAGAPDGAAGGGAQLDRLGSALGFFVHTGLAGLDGLDPLLEELGLGDDALLEGDGDGDDDEDWDPPASGDPVAVVPAPLARHGGVCLTCVEVRERGLAVHWHLSGGGERCLEGPELRVSDDTGTDYGEMVGGGASSEGEDGPVSGTSEYAVPIPPQARTLMVRSGSGEWSVPLPADARRR